MRPLDPVDVRAELEEILSREEYQVYYREEQSWITEVLNQLKEILKSILMRLFPQANVAERAYEWLTYGIVGLGILLLLLLMYMVWSRFKREGRFHPTPIGTERELAMSTGRHLQEADQLAKDGHYPLALRHLLLAYILYLDQRQWIVAKPWKTNGEYFDEVYDVNPQSAKFFYQLAQKFEETMYGGRIVNKDEFSNLRQQVEEWISPHPHPSNTHATKGERV